MRVLSGSAWYALAAFAIVGLSACERHQETPPVAALPPPPPPPPPAPAAPNPDEQVQGQLAQLGAIQTAHGWTLTLADTKFRGGKVALEPSDTRIQKVADALKSSPHLRVLIEAYTAQKRSKSHALEVSQIHANAVLRALTADGADEARIQAQGLVDPHDQRVDIVFSNAAGEFPPPPA